VAIPTVWSYPEVVMTLVAEFALVGMALHAGHLKTHEIALVITALVIPF
jgi:hypothetical protein